nr:hypothetical protein [Treponema sp.]
MSVQNSTFNTSHVMENEIVKASDFEFAFECVAENVSKATQMFLESNQDFVINGKVLPYQGMNVQISPIYGVCKSTGIPFGRTETAVMDYGFEESTSGRVDIIEVRGEWETYDNQQRAFNDPDTDIQTYQYVDTKKLMRPIYQIKKGVEGSSVAPEVDEGYVKLAEIVIRANASTILQSDIKNITADIAGLNNEDWTTEPDITYNIGYISDINKRFRVQHNEDGSHKDNVIDTDSLNIGIGTKQINGNVLPIGNAVTIPTQQSASTDTIYSTITKVVAVVTSLYNAYLKFGSYGFKGTLSISSIADANNTLTKPISISAPGDGTAAIKVNNNSILSIDANGKLSTNGYTPTENNHIVTKAITDAISSSISLLSERITNVESEIANQIIYTNKVLSSGPSGRYNIDAVILQAATTANITLSGLQTVDGVALSNGQFVLVKNQTNSKDNGIYQVSSNSTWGRHSSYSKPENLKGKLFNIISGTTNSGKMFYLPNETFINANAFGSDDILFSEHFSALFAKGHKLIMRDSDGRAKVAAPVESDDIARKAEIDNLYGEVKGKALGTAAVGTCLTFARSDHVHPIPSTVSYANKVCTVAATAAADRNLLLGEAAYTGTCCSGVYVANNCKATFNPNTGVLTAKTFSGALSGTATNATCFGGCTYACAKADILTGNAATATNATCFGGCTYAQACANIRSGLTSCT